MSEASVRAWFAANAPDIAIIDQGVSTATVLEAAQALGVEPARIAKTLSLRVGDTVALVCTRGDARLHNAKAKAALGAKPRMLGADEVEAITGHPVGGVCPFGLAAPLPVYCDVSLQAFATVFPAAGSRTSSVELTPARLAQLTDAKWIDICTLPETVE
ncbi:MAG: YbaK/EbsC family protein [Pseudomonadota bacterium]|uniref:Cys-tRNA(Pro)/cys-tRNA(Cys) deacylase n=1 Tax=Sphingobium xenophagum TaxID=121428 RepID=A0A249MUS0_SPHXE|nr:MULTISPECIES: YbaK/EbsC family protein [Sphingobium]ASY44889.1 cys-tRNA(pro)/cys-tRNA(cys) deacylase [Sphingobium xenophagum]OUC54083.1 cys-tRNA(pro)/cys-tRNA(cys) deacylase [Sphingobium sp. GW456-12-10-14-TSB1]QWT14757.1 YbaK/EbsC family protein [Sphingobium xenophagum]|tara:strand:+ start:1977 stop:2453 length:477 start_codon:yes stop_codon:yes gene_type:complete